MANFWSPSAFPKEQDPTQSSTDPTATWPRPPLPSAVVGGGVWNLARGTANAVGSGINSAASAASSAMQSASHPAPPTPSAPYQDSQTSPAPYSPPPSPQSAGSASSTALDPLSQSEADLNAARARQANAEATKAEAEAKKAADDLAKSNDPNSMEYQTAQAALATAQARKAQAEKERDDAMHAMSPSDLARLQSSLQQDNTRLQDELARARDDANRSFTRGETDRQIEAQQRIADRQAKLEENRMLLDHSDKEADRRQNADQFNQEMGVKQGEATLNRDKFEYQKGADQKNLDLQGLKEEHDFAIRTLANQISSGELSLKKASEKFNQWLAKSKLPSEIAANKAAADAPYMPYATSMKAGDIPVGFEGGGPMEQLVKMGGGSYNPGNYAVNPVSVNNLRSGNVPGNSNHMTGPAPAPQAAPPAAAPGGTPPMVANMMPGYKMTPEQQARIQKSIGAK